VWGVPERPRGTIDKPIGRHPRVRDKMAVRAGGRPAVTHWEVLERYRGRAGAPVASLIACRLETGRTHQIRVHLSEMGHPLLGDALYGGTRKGDARVKAVQTRLGRQALHAWKLAFPHPRTGKVVSCEAPVPADLAAAVDALSTGF
jgi:23S rRNA pseudouridine1911/1915/1917 synthase